VVVVTGITAVGNREVLGCDVEDSEEGPFGPRSCAAFANAAFREYTS
jgi:transposase-like protein